MKLVITLIPFIIFGCVQSGGNGTEYLSSGIWEGQYKYPDGNSQGTDTTLVKKQIMISEGGNMDFRFNYYSKGDNYNELFQFKRIVGTHQLVNDSLILIAKTIQDTCCNNISAVNLLGITSKPIDPSKNRQAVKIRNLNATSFEWYNDDGGQVSWTKFQKQ